MYECTSKCIKLVRNKLMAGIQISDISALRFSWGLFYSLLNWKRIKRNSLKIFIFSSCLIIKFCNNCFKKITFFYTFRNNFYAIEFLIKLKLFFIVDLFFQFHRTAKTILTKRITGNRQISSEEYFQTRIHSSWVRSPTRCEKLDRFNSWTRDRSADWSFCTSHRLCI